MQNENIVFLEILRLNNVELWNTKNGHAHYSSKGNLLALYNKEIGLFCLHFNDFTFNLTRSLEVISSYNGGESYFSYTIPHYDSYYTFKVPAVLSGPVLANLDTFLAHTSRLIRKDGVEEYIGNLHKNKIAEGFNHVLDTISHAFGVVHDKNTSDSANHRIIRSFQDMLVIDDPRAPMVDIPSSEVENMIQDSADIISKSQDTKWWRDIRGEHQPVLIQEDGYLFMENKKGLQNTDLESWGSNVTDKSQRSEVAFETELDKKINKSKFAGDSRTQTTKLYEKKIETDMVGNV